MGIEAFSLGMLCRAKAQGASFRDTVTLGRQRISMLPAELDEAIACLGPRRPDARPWGQGVPPFAEDLLPHLLGIDRLVSLDNSAYEGATWLHDMNVPIPAAQADAYDAVIDGGTLEHVFNVAIALANAMRMLRVGGRFFSLSPANNHCGHGFYQFSPELFYRAFGPANGFEIEHVLAIEHPFPGIELSTRRRVYEVRDPALVGDRVGLVNDRPVYLFVQAVKRTAVDPFTVAPQQSDYMSAWRGDGPRQDGRSDAWLSSAWQVLPYRARRLLSGYWQRLRRDTFRNPRTYRRWTPPAPPHGG